MNLLDVSHSNKSMKPNELSLLHITHQTNIDYWIENNKDLDLYFICTERNEPGFKYPTPPIDEKYKNYKNTLYFDFKELNEREDYTVENIVNDVCNKLSNFLKEQNINVELNKKKGLERLKNMNNMMSFIVFTENIEAVENNCVKIIILLYIHYYNDYKIR